MKQTIIAPALLIVALGACAAPPLPKTASDTATGPRVLQVDPLSRNPLPPSRLAARPGGAVDIPAFRRLFNQVRARNGLQKARANATLSGVAAAHARDMERNGYFSHLSQDGSRPAQRVTRAGYSWSFVAENIASGLATRGSVVDAWLDSPTHREAMLDPRVREFGIGRYDDTWVLLVAEPK